MIKNLWLVLLGLLFFPAVFLIFIMFLTSLLLAGLVLAMVGMVEFSRKLINTCNCAG